MPGYRSMFDEVERLKSRVAELEAAVERLQEQVALLSRTQAAGAELAGEWDKVWITTDDQTESI